MVGYLHANAESLELRNRTSGQKNQSFMEMMKSAKDYTQDEELENEESFFLKKESSNTQRGKF